MIIEKPSFTKGFVVLMNGVGIVFLGFVSYGTLHIKVCYLVTCPPLMDYLLTSDCRHMALNHGSGMVQLIA